MGLAGLAPTMPQEQPFAAMLPVDCIWLLFAALPPPSAVKVHIPS